VDLAVVRITSATLKIPDWLTDELWARYSHSCYWRCKLSSGQSSRLVTFSSQFKSHCGPFTPSVCSGQLSLPLQQDGKWAVAYGIRGKGLMWVIGAVVCLLAASCVQLFADAGNGWPHDALRYHYLMPISCHVRDSKVLVFTNLTHVSSCRLMNLCRHDDRAVYTHGGVEVSASCSWISCPGMRITVDVVRGMQTEWADCDRDPLLRADELPGLTDDRPDITDWFALTVDSADWLDDWAVDADWLAVTQSTASDMTFMLLCRTPAWTFCCIAAFNL